MFWSWSVTLPKRKLRTLEVSVSFNSLRSCWLCCPHPTNPTASIITERNASWGQFCCEIRKFYLTSVASWAIYLIIWKTSQFRFIYPSIFPSTECQRNTRKTYKISARTTIYILYHFEGMILNLKQMIIFRKKYAMKN